MLAQQTLMVETSAFAWSTVIKKVAVGIVGLTACGIGSGAVAIGALLVKSQIDTWQEYRDNYSPLTRTAVLCGTAIYWLGTYTLVQKCFAAPSVARQFLFSQEKA